MNKGEGVAEVSQVYLVAAAEQAVPVGYKQTEVGVIPEDWEATRFGDLYERSIARKNLKPSDFITFVGMQDVSESAQLVSQHELLYSEIKLGLTYFERGDVLVAKITPCFENGKGCHTEKLETGVGFGSTEFHVLRASGSADSKFIYFWTTRESFRNALELEMVGSAGHRRVPYTALQNYLVPCPVSKKEQAAIANALSDVDALLSELEKLIAKKQAIKTATMQQLLTGRTRLPQFALREDGSPKGYKQSELGEVPEDWEVIPFGQLVSPSPMRVNPKLYGGGDFCIELEHIAQGAGHLTGNTKTKGESSLKSVFDEGDVLFGKLRAYLRKYWFANQEGVCSTEIWVLRADKHKSVSKFIFYVVQTEAFIEAASEAYGTHMPRADWKVVRELSIATPRAEEQTAIATILSDMDEEIQALEQRLNKTRQIKQGMMQELLTGRIRLVQPSPGVTDHAGESTVSA